jgi:hypothetical protein
MPEDLAHDLPEEVYQLGEPLEAYPRSGWRLAASLLLWGLGAMLGAAMTVGFAGELLGFFQMGGEDWINYLGLIVGPAMFIGGLYMLIRVLVRSNQCVLLFRDGFARIQDKKAEVCRWDEVEELKRDVTITYHEAFIKTTEYVYKIRGADGRQIVINSAYDRLKDLAKLGESLARESCRALRERIMPEWQAGRPVQLGGVTVSRTGLTRGKETLAWDEIKSLQLTGDKVVIGVEGRWINWPDATLCNVPSAPLFLELVEQARAKPPSPGG